MAKRLAELGALQDAVSNNESNPSRLGLAGYIRGLFLDWSANPYNPLTRLSARGRLLGYFWDSGAIGLSMDFANQSFIVKDGTLQSKSFSDIVNFSRTSNATVTNSSGVITYAPHNLLTYSEQFDNAAWTKTNATIIANAVNAPNGYQTADSITRTVTSSSSQARFTSAQSNSTTYTLSVYAKAGTTNNSLALRNLAVDNGFTNGVVKFNLNNGTIDLTYGSTYTGKASIISVGDGWYRCSITGTTIASVVNNLVDIGQASSLAAEGSIGDFLYIWGAQLEVGSTATTYNPTTVKNLLGYSELFDNAAWTKSNSFVQTNLLTYSEAFDNAAWVNVGTTELANTVTAPNGYQTADTLIDNATTGRHSIYEAYTTSALTYTFSVYAKAGTLNYVKVGIATTGTNGVYFNLSNGTKGTEDAGFTGAIESVGNGWYRCSITTLLTAAANYAQIMLSTNGSDAVSYTGTGAGTVYLWGAQLVQGSVAGDYRRTDSTSLPVYYANHNGVVCAEKLVETSAASASHWIFGSNTLTAIPYVMSIYAKAGERNWVKVSCGIAGVPQGAFFNLSTGTTGTVDAGITAYPPVSLGNGWYRLAIGFTGTAAAYFPAIRTTTADNVSVYTGNGTSGIYIFGAQVSDSASLDPYVLNVATAPSAAAYYGARFDYDPVTLAPKGLLIEEQRANLLLQSENFATTWAVSGTSVVVNQIASPNGNTTADFLLEDGTAAANHRVSQTSSVTSGTSYTLSCFVKKGTRQFIQLFFPTADFGANAFANFDVNLGVVGAKGSAATSSIVAYPNGWYRCIVTAPATATNASSLSLIQIVTSASAARSEIYTGDGTSGLYLWGAQLEAGAFATSYIPTAASQVTRAADVATIQGSNFYGFYNQNEGSVVVKAFINTGNAGSYQYVINDGTGNNYIRVGNNTNTVNAQLAANGTNTVNIQTNIGIPNNHENIVAFGYKINDVAACGKPNNIVLDTSNTPPIVNQLQLGVSNNNPIKSISYYNTRLSDATLKGLTA